MLLCERFQELIPSINKRLHTFALLYIPLVAYPAKTPSPLPYPETGTRAHGGRIDIVGLEARNQEGILPRTGSEKERRIVVRQWGSSIR